MANVAFSSLGHCYVLVQNEHAASDDEWEKWVAFVSKGGESSRSLMRVLIVSAGGSPTPKQRAAIHKLMPASGEGVPTAVVTASIIGRTIVTAMNLFNGRVRAFSPDRISDALDYLGIVAHGPEVLELVARLHEEVGLRFTRPASTAR